MTISNKLRIIGLAGTNGSGKDTVGHILADRHGYLFVSITDLLRAEAERRGQPVEREVLRAISAEWRRESGRLGVLVDKAIAVYEPVKDKYQGLVMASLRNPGEADRVHELGGTVVWVDADPWVRYERIQANAVARGRAKEDIKTFEQFQAEEAAEMNKPSGGDAANLNMSGVKDRCDASIINNQEKLDELTTLIDKILNAPDQPAAL
jgi:dephospho-CoA kinase